ncbi:hypothetical protein [Streptomyces fractus]|uniref:DUF7927 domain-containing protein n=1 Tax=Streptomyces fractus TaxID=641806 RepID=UPI003CEC88EC
MKHRARQVALRSAALAACGLIALAGGASAASAQDGPEDTVQMSKKLTQETVGAEVEYHYQITLTNKSETTAQGVHVEDNLSNVLDDAEFKQQVSSTTGVVHREDSVVTWEGDIGAHETATITYVLTPKPDKGVLENQAVASWMGKTSALCSSTYDTSASSDATSETSESTSSGEAGTSCTVSVQAPQTEQPPSQDVQKPPATAETPPKACPPQAANGDAAQGGAGRPVGPDGKPCVTAPHAGGGGAAQELAAATVAEKAQAEDPSTGSMAAAAALLTGAAAMICRGVIKRRRRTGD